MINLFLVNPRNERLNIRIEIKICKKNPPLSARINITHSFFLEIKIGNATIGKEFINFIKIEIINIT